jgi:hypothetical protein
MEDFNSRSTTACTLDSTVSAHQSLENFFYMDGGKFP